ncbi:oxygen-dependent protoporphyrinogen oxidase [Xylanibacter ruminicola]|uniref:Coproporphyrinogen III oxidase n=1 Tax=Xylanibacter ruminicola TaxID=839 RepID=A0A1H5X560_XYLRU|nr:protoporphyrinogen oxidase [Xylanibacter ruminicola]SEG06406.1 oxygen-dependent protoporphyrinogen oxidase [Xylanibacter ruminicola]
MQERDIVVVGAGLTGLSTAFNLRQKGRDVLVLEKENRIGGQIRTHREDGFTFESGPNTGVVSFPEVTELFQNLEGRCEMETARESSKRRLIWKGNKFHALPSGPLSAITTPLFTLSDKFRILGEPWRKKGTDPDEPVGSLAQRRLGRSFYEYAVDPFVSGVYAGDPMKLTTRYALPKLYNLEARYGSFIRGAMAKAKEPKTDRDRLVTKKVFSAKGGLEHLVEALAEDVDIILNARDIRINPESQGWWKVTFDNGAHEVRCRHVITTVGAYELPQMLPFVPDHDLRPISQLYYAPVIQVCVGIRHAYGLVYPAFGGLVPSKEQQRVLGILFPSECFVERAPEGGALYSYFMGGSRHADYLSKSDEEIRAIVLDAFHSMLKYPIGVEPDMIRIFRHEHAIPQYGVDSGARFEAVDRLQQQYPGLILAGNLRDGIGMGNRIHQGAEIAALF